MKLFIGLQPTPDRIKRSVLLITTFFRTNKRSKVTFSARIYGFSSHFSAHSDIFCGKRLQSKPCKTFRKAKMIKQIHLFPKTKEAAGAANCLYLCGVCSIIRLRSKKRTHILLYGKQTDYYDRNDLKIPHIDKTCR